MRNCIEVILRRALEEAENQEARAREAHRADPLADDEEVIDELAAKSQERRDAIRWVQQVADNTDTRQIELIAENARLKCALMEIRNRRNIT